MIFTDTDVVAVPRRDLESALDLFEFLLEGEFRVGGALDMYEAEKGTTAAELGEVLTRLSSKTDGPNVGWTAKDLHWRSEG